MKRLITLIIALTLTLSLCLGISSCGTNYTDTVKFDKNNTLVVAHRGLSGLESENTDAAFRAAGERSYYGIEADIRKTSDGFFAVCHDETLKRVGGEDLNVESSSLEALQEVILFDKNGNKSREDLRVTTLENYISICKGYGKQCFLELKSYFSEEEISRIASTIESFDYLENVTFISFHYDNLLRVRKILPDQSVQYLFSEITNETVEMLIRDKIDASIDHKALTKSAVDSFHSAGLKVGCWTVDSKKDAERLAGWGVDYITTNILE